MQVFRNWSGPGRAPCPERMAPPFCPRRGLYVTDRINSAGGAGNGNGTQMSERQSSFGYEDLLACGRGELFGAGNAQLPLPPMLMFDRISEISEHGRRIRQGFHPRRTRREAGTLVFRLPLQGRSGDAGLPRPRCALADGRIFPGLARLTGPRPCSWPGRTEVLRHGAAERAQDRLQRRLQARDAIETRARHRRRVAFRRWRDYLSRKRSEGRPRSAGGDGSAGT